MDPNLKYLRVVEAFHSIQGEGYWTGMPMAFIRLQGCNLSCPFCDTNHKKGSAWSLLDIRAFLIKTDIRHICITGGEPMLHSDGLKDLVRYLIRNRYEVHLETNGTIIDNDIFSRCWVTISPKTDSTDPEERYLHASEVKVLVGPDGIYGIPTDEFEYADQRFPIGYKFLQPIASTPDSKSYISSLEDSGVLNRIYDIIKLYPTWRLSLQFHKILNLR